MMIFLLGSEPDPGLAFLRWRFTLALRVLNYAVLNDTPDDGLTLQTYDTQHIHRNK